MSYFNYPRLHFSGRFKASPSTINNTPNNYDPTVYPSPNALQDVELYWNPKGDGGFALVDCVVTRVDYADGTSSVTNKEDPIVGQPVASIKGHSFPLEAALVDLDPMQQNVSEIWAMMVQIGGASLNVTGSFTAVSFYAIWGQAQGKHAPHSSASGSGVYQSTLKNTELNGEPGTSKFLNWIADNPSANLSININLNTHNNKPPIYRFDAVTFEAMGKAEKPVPPAVLDKIEPMQKLIQNAGDTPGDVPVQDFVVFMLQQYLPIEEFNANIDTIIEITKVPYKGSTSEDFLYGLVTGSVGPAEENEALYFVPNRMMCPQTQWISQQASNPCYFAPFLTSADGKSVIVNLGNSLPTELPGIKPFKKKLHELWLVSFPSGEIYASQAEKLVQIPYDDPDFITNKAGLFSKTLDEDLSQVPLGIMSVFPPGSTLTESVVLAENKDGYYLRADQFVYRMNPGLKTTPEFPRGDTASVDIHVLKFGQPVEDGTEITMKMMNECQASLYTFGTLGTSGTKGIENLSIPQDALKINGQTIQATSKTTGGIATFEFKCEAPGNPRHYVDGQVYFLNYGFKDSTVYAFYIQDVNDIVSVLVYNEETEMTAPDVLAKFGRLYKIMNFLTDEEKVKQIDRRNMIKLLLEKPFTELEHMPVTRDLGAAARAKIVSWIDELNNS